MKTMNVPLVDLKLQHERIAADVFPAMSTVLENTSFVLGPAVTKFEQEYATYSGAAHAIGVGNGTDAIELGLRAAGLQPGDEVIIPANTFVATAEAVVRAGGVIRLADCDENYLLDTTSLADQLTPRTRAVIGVDLYGQVAPFEKITSVVGDDILLFEDGAQSQGARRHGQAAGSFGSASATSFYPGKNLGAYGDAGAVTTNSDAVDEMVRKLRNHGGVNRYEHIAQGTNSRLDSLQAVILSLKLAVLDSWNSERRTAAARYAELLADVDQVVLPGVAEGNEHVWHLFVVRVPDRDRVLAELNAHGVGAGLHYPRPIHTLPAFTDLGIAAGAFRTAEATAGQILSLPIYPGITPDQQQYVVDQLRLALGASGA